MEAPFATVWVRLPVTVILPVDCCCSEELGWFWAEELLCNVFAEELATLALEELAFATLEELAFTLLFEDCTFAEDVPGMTLAEESCGCAVADDVAVTSLVEDA